MHKDQFLEEVAFRLRNYFKASKEGHKSDVERHRIEGFMEASKSYPSETTDYAIYETPAIDRKHNK